MQETVNVIVINWELKDYTEENILKLDKEYDYGIYAIYGEHLAYGKDALLYIGLAERQTFSKRMMDGGRFNSDFIHTTVIPKTMRIGRLSKLNSITEKEAEIYDLANYYKNWEKNIIEAERILIGTHIPALNKKLNHSHTLMNYGEKCHKIHNAIYRPHYIILNKGDIGSLSPEISTIKNSANYYDFEEYLDTNDRRNYL